MTGCNDSPRAGTPQPHSSTVNGGYVGAKSVAWTPPSEVVALPSPLGGTGAGYFIMLGTQDFITSFPGKGADTTSTGKGILGMGSPTGASYADEHNAVMMDGHTHPALDDEIEALGVITPPPTVDPNADPDAPLGTLTDGRMFDLQTLAYALVERKRLVQLAGNGGSYDTNAYYSVTQKADVGFQINYTGDKKNPKYLTGDDAVVAYVSGADTKRAFCYYNTTTKAFQVVVVPATIEDPTESKSKDTNDSTGKNPPKDINMDAPGPNAGERQRGRYIWWRLLDAGATEKGAAAALGNFYEESRFDPRADNNGQSYGIVQWLTNGRWRDLLAYANKHGKNEWSIELQCDFMLHELHSSSYLSAWRAIKNATDISTATLDFHDIYEGSRDNAAQRQERVDAAKHWYQEFNDLQDPSARAGGQSQNREWVTPIRNLNNQGYDFGAQRNYSGYPGLGHTGEDYPSTTNGRIVRAMTDCTVVTAGKGSVNRITMAVDTAAGPLRISCIHGDNIRVKDGQRLKMGDPICDVSGVGSSGGPHLHIDFWWGTGEEPYGKNLINPNEVMRALFQKTPGDDYGSQTSPKKPDYSADHLKSLRRKLVGMETTEEASASDPTKPAKTPPDMRAWSIPDGTFEVAVYVNEKKLGLV